MTNPDFTVPDTYPVDFAQAIPHLEIIAKAAAHKNQVRYRDELLDETDMQRVNRLRRLSSNLDNFAHYGSLADKMALAVTSLDPTLAATCRMDVRQRIESAHDRLALMEHYQDFLETFESQITWISRADMDARFAQIIASPRG